MLVFTGVLSSYKNAYLLHNFIIALFLGCSLLVSRETRISQLAILYAFFSCFSFISQLYVFGIEDVSLNGRYFTLILISILLLSINKVKDNFSFESVVLINVSLLPVLFILGGFDTTWQGRITTEYLNPNLQGMAVFLGFMVCLINIIERKFLIISTILFLSCSIFLVMSGSRQNLIFIMIGVAFLIITIIFTKNYFLRNNLLKKTSILTIGFVSSIFVSYYFVELLLRRFGLTSIDELIMLVSSSGIEYSAGERLNYIWASLLTIIEYPFGVGFGNVKHGISTFGSDEFKITSNAHSFFAESNFSSGAIGLIFWFVTLLYITLLAFNRINFKRYGYIPPYLLVASFISPLLSFKLFWVILVILEMQLRENIVKCRNVEM